MKVRDKLFLGMAALILFMAAVFLTISQGYVKHLFQQYAMAARQGQVQQWEQLLAYYYVQNDGSWEGVGQFVTAVVSQQLATKKEPLRFLLLDSKRQVVLSLGVSGGHPDLGTGWEVPVTVAGQTVGILWVSDQNIQGLAKIEGTILHSMTLATVTGVILTTVAALLVAAWLARRITEPLRALIDATRRIQKGDLGPRLSIATRDEFGEVAQAFNEMALQLSRIEETRRHLVADVAHELRTPLTIIQGQLELIQQGVKRAEPETLLPIQDEVMRLTRLVGDLHQLSLAEAGRLPLEKTWTDLTALAGRIVDNFQIEAEAKEITLSLEASDSIPVYVDPHRMTQVIVNLVGNALRYTPTGGTIRIVVRQEGSEAILAVSDTGPGIRPEHLPHIFDRFFRSDEARSREEGGTGLGLAIAKEFVEAHGGRIGAESRPGEGTTFTVRLPKGLTVTDRASLQPDDGFRRDQQD
ncbi:sensor histidine kinase [Kyrpidia tusciae]|uniref:histidine kinase n=1 Tax=Kyrpidia tusciae (strain DSM 2912 / NBRC 15312 / T2) TaxID=562970 RepID=D5WQL1_KYRT2|nr:ATP-binding protein [Kyrpidia tusciae]ADG06620.1 integral membrane sensor signal transduction histidine kinase [Kyrpidia tusciae DSM 2912]